MVLTRRAGRHCNSCRGVRVREGQLIDGIPQRLKPEPVCIIFGTAEAVP
jgi:hypothetical protein